MKTREATRRTVEVSGHNSYGTGCLLAPGLVLTAHHVAKPGASNVVKLRDVASSDFTRATVVWESTGLDAVLLRADPALVGAGAGAVSFGELICDHPGHRPVCTATGFPRAMRRRASVSPERYVDDLKTVDGRIAPHTGSRSQLYGLEVEGSLPGDVKGWQGLSGAGVFCEGMLVGLLALVDRTWDRTLMALPISQLLAADGFTSAVTDCTGGIPRLQAADLRPLLGNTPKPTLSSSYLLDPRSQAVGHSGMASLVEQIERWCRGTGPVDVAAVTGLGGTGKSRMVIELLDRLSTTLQHGRPWSGGFLAETPAHTDYGLLGSARYPLLIAVDLAETRRAQVRDVVQALAEQHDGERVRLLLLARTASDWWPSLRRELRREQAGPVSETFHVAPGDALGRQTPEDIYVDAKVAFARRIRLLQQAGLGDDTWRETVVADAPRHYGASIEHASDQPVIYHHIAALADVLARANPDFARKDHPMEVLLANEENYLRRIAAAHLPHGTVDDKLIRTLVTSQFLAGARTASEGARAVRVAFDIHHHSYGATAAPDPSRLAALNDVLAAAYPATDGAHWGAIGTPLATALLTEVETDSGNEFVESFLQHDALEHSQRRQTLRVIAHTAQETPELAVGAHRAVAAEPELLLPLAAKAAAGLESEQAHHWLTGVKEAVTEQARRPDADPDTYQWAANFLAQTAAWPASEPDGPYGYEEFIDSLLAEDVADNGDSDDDAGDDSRDADRPAPALTFLRPQVGWPTKALVTLMSLCHLILVAGVTSSAVHSSDLKQAGWTAWLFVALLLSGHVAMAAMYGSIQMNRANMITWVGPPFIVGLTTLLALTADLPLPSPWPPWVLWPVVFGGGLYSLTFAWRIWFGQLRTSGAPLPPGSTH
ncbi:serine protease [Streptomyces sp900116325]|uniref:S1 family peptidase n=1 Tax=Streptomyces sp. 900116325 TaxID=3154295 RepID=UPI003331D586